MIRLKFAVRVCNEELRQREPHLRLRAPRTSPWSPPEMNSLDGLKAQKVCDKRRCLKHVFDKRPTTTTATNFVQWELPKASNTNELTGVVLCAYWLGNADACRRIHDQSELGYVTHSQRHLLLAGMADTPTVCHHRIRLIPKTADVWRGEHNSRFRRRP